LTVTVEGVNAMKGVDLAGVVTQEPDGSVVGGFVTEVGADNSTTQVVYRPAEQDQLVGAWPHVADRPVALVPGSYVLTLWIDVGGDTHTQWLLLDASGQGSPVCEHRFDVGDESTAEVTIRIDVSTGDLALCERRMNPAEAEPVEVVEFDRQPATAPFADVLTVDSLGSVHQLLVWRDGFLAVGGISAPTQLAGQLPDEIADQFPAEIQDLFPDGLPATVEEAMAVIEAAGLFDVVLEAVQSIPGAYEAIYAADQNPPAPLFAWSADGLEWERLEGSLPDEVAVLMDVAANGDQLVAVGHRPNSPAANPPAEVHVAQTGDLSTWTTVRVGPDAPSDLPDGAQFWLLPVSLVANDVGWMVTTQTVVDLGEADAPDAPSRELAPYLVPAAFGPEPVVEYWFGNWGGGVVPTDPSGPGVPPGVDAGLLVATDTGFVHFGPFVGYTSDGTTWRTQSGMAPSFNVYGGAMFSQPIDDGFVVYVDEGGGGPAVYRVDDTGSSWSPLALSGFPTDLFGFGNSNAYVLEAGGDDQWLVATSDGEHWVLETFDDIDSDNVSVDPRTDTYTFRVAAIHDDVLLVGDGLPGGYNGWWLHAF
jgi:hypothetical protein